MIKLIEKRSAIPLYLKVKEHLIKQIKNGDYKTDQKIPGENELTGIYNVSQITVRKALSELVNEGYLYRLQGKGTFVAKRKINRMLNLMSFTEEMRSKELKCVSRVLEIKSIKESGIAQELETLTTEPIIKVERLRIIDELPVAIQSSYLPAAIISLERLQDIYQQHSLYKVLSDAGIYPARAYEKYNVDVLRDNRLCTLLKMEQGAPVFKVNRYTYTEDNQLFEYAVSILKGELYTMEVELTK